MCRCANIIGTRDTYGARICTTVPTRVCTGECNAHEYDRTMEARGQHWVLKILPPPTPRGRACPFASIPAFPFPAIVFGMCT